MAEQNLSADSSQIGNGGVNLDRTTETARSILIELKSTLDGLGPLAGQGETAQAFLTQYTPAAQGGFDLIDGVSGALTTGADQVFSNVKALTNTEHVNSDAVDHSFTKR